MKRLAFALLLALAALPALAETTAADRAKLVSELERTRAAFLKSVDGLSAAQWSYKPAPEKWSIAEVAEHIAAAESLIRGVASKAMEAPAAEELLKGAVKDEMILTMIPNRSQKFKAPEPLIPINRFATPAATVAEYKKQRAEAIRLAGGDTDFRKYAAAHPAFGPLDTYGWLLFLSAHSERHTLQIEEVKASPGFPKE